MPSLAAKEAVYVLLTDLLAGEATPAELIPSPSAAEAGALGGPMGPSPTHGLPLQTCLPLDAARYANCHCNKAECGLCVHTFRIV